MKSQTTVHRARIATALRGRRRAPLTRSKMTDAHKTSLRIWVQFRAKRQSHV